MGYHTDFTGGFSLSKKLTKKKLEYLENFSGTRRMKRDSKILMELFKGKHGYPGRKGDDPIEIYGKDGEYFVGGTGHAGQDHDKSVIEYNTPPGQLSWKETSHMDFNSSYKLQLERIKNGECQPSLWCLWVVEQDENGNQFVVWDGGEKFYEYIAWIRYLIDHFFKPWKVRLNGEVFWIGEDDGDRGKIVIKNNVVKVYLAKSTFIETNE